MVTLVVDADPADRAFILQTLADEGHSAVGVTNGSEALVTMEQTRPEVVLLSLTLPDLDGPVVRERIRSLPGFAATPVIFLVTMQEVENTTFGLAIGDDFITKPLRPAELLLRLNSMLLLLDRRQVLVNLLTRQQLGALKHTAGMLMLRAREILQDPRISGEVRHTASAILVDSRELLRFTLNLLDLSAVDEQPFAPGFERVSMLPLVRAVIRSMEVRAKIAGVSLHTDGYAPTSTLDPRIFRRILANLIDHAILRAPSGTDVEIGMTADPSGVVLLRIVDSGPSISPSLFVAALRRPSLFAIEGDDAGYVTLGLAFCTLAVELLGGRMWVEDGKPGTAFCVELSSPC